MNERRKETVKVIDGWASLEIYLNKMNAPVFYTKGGFQMDRKVEVKETLVSGTAIYTVISTGLTEEFCEEILDQRIRIAEELEGAWNRYMHSISEAEEKRDKALAAWSARRDTYLRHPRWYRAVFKFDEPFPRFWSDAQGGLTVDYLSDQVQQMDQRYGITHTQRG